MPASATLTNKGSPALAQSDACRMPCPTPPLCTSTVALDDSLSKFVFHESMTPDASALIRAMCALALSGELMRIRIFIYLPPKAGFTLAWASPEVGRWSLVTPRRRSNPAPGCTLPRVGVLTWFFCINTAPW